MPGSTQAQRDQWNRRNALARARRILWGKTTQPQRAAYGLKMTELGRRRIASLERLLRDMHAKDPDRDRDDHLLEVADRLSQIALPILVETVKE